MSKVKMLDPVGYQWLDTGHFRKKIPKGCDVSAFRKLVTVEQAKAYTEARVREALGEACQVIEAMPVTCVNQSLLKAKILKNIRTLIANQTGDSNVETD